MVVKEKRGRRRYIIFSGKGVSKKEIYDIIKSSDMDLKLVFKEGEYFIIRCPHTDKERVINLFMKKGGERIRSLKTSGTIKKLKEYLKSIGASHPEP